MNGTIRNAERQEQDFAAEASQTRDLVRDLYLPQPRTYWTDMLLTGALGWSAFGLACIFPWFSPAMLACVLIAAAGLYRGLCFIHEISHLNARAVPGFETVWNLLFGYTLLMPSFVYCGVHQSHHKLTTYGTKLDPEYMAFGSSSRMTVAFAMQSIFIPLALLVRFLVMGPVGMVVPKFQKFLTVYASSLTINFAYRREVTEELVGRIRRQSAAILLLWNLAILLALTKVMPWKVFGVWLAVSALVSFVNTLRTLGAHAYESTGETLDRQQQLLDSIDTPGAFWTELWAPVGLRYHALHHYFPGIPYHNLRPAYQRIVESLPHDAAYHGAHSPSLARSLRNLYGKGRR